MSAFSRGISLMVLLKLWSTVVVLPVASQISMGDKFKLWDSSRNLGIKIGEPFASTPVGNAVVTTNLVCTRDLNEVIEVVWDSNENMADASNPNKVLIGTYIHW